MNIFKLLLKLFVIVPAFISSLTQFLYSLSHEHFQGELHFCLPTLALTTAVVVEYFFYTTDKGKSQYVTDVLKKMC